jgi:hypothetical protein
MLSEDDPRVQALLQRVEVLNEALGKLQAKPRWRRIWSLDAEHDLIMLADRLLDEVARLTGQARTRVPAPVVRGWRGPLFWWWVQQANGVWLAFSLLCAVEDGSAWRVMLNIVLIFIALHWKVPPYKQARKGKWRNDG